MAQALDQLVTLGSAGNQSNGNNATITIVRHRETHHAKRSARRARSTADGESTPRRDGCSSATSVIFNALAIRDHDTVADVCQQVMTTKKTAVMMMVTGHWEVAG